MTNNATDIAYRRTRELWLTAVGAANKSMRLQERDALDRVREANGLFVELRVLRTRLAEEVAAKVNAQVGTKL